MAKTKMAPISDPNTLHIPVGEEAMNAVIHDQRTRGYWRKVNRTLSEGSRLFGKIDDVLGNGWSKMLYREKINLTLEQENAFVEMKKWAIEVMKELKYGRASLSDSTTPYWTGNLRNSLAVVGDWPRWIDIGVDTDKLLSKAGQKVPVIREGHQDEWDTISNFDYSGYDAYINSHGSAKEYANEHSVSVNSSEYGATDSNYIGTVWDTVKFVFAQKHNLRFIRGAK